MNFHKSNSGVYNSNPGFYNSNLGVHNSNFDIIKPLVEQVMIFV
jgi:hypothetical protein